MFEFFPTQLINYIPSSLVDNFSCLRKQILQLCQVLLQRNELTRRGTNQAQDYVIMREIKKKKKETKSKEMFLNPPTTTSVLYFIYLLL